MNGGTRFGNEHNKQAQLAEHFNEFYLQLTSSGVDQIGSYQIEKEIGEGAFGKVYLATHIILGLKVVLKCGLIDDPNIVREIYYHKQLKHKNIVNLYEVIKTEKHIWLALEYCSGGELFYYIYEKKRLGINETQNLFIQIVLAVKYVHSFNLSHRDLKLENILLADSKKSLIKLSDFGFIREYNPQARKFLSTICGTNVYMAPELLKNEKYSGFAIDIWALGVILYTMVYGEMPFDEDDDLKTKYKIIHEEPRYPEIIPQDLIQLIKKLLSKDPNQRPNLNEILNSNFLIDLHTKYLRKMTKSTDAESIISIHQHYNQNQRPFTTKLERDLLNRLRKLNVNMDQLEYSIYKNEMNPLTAFYELLLTEEFNKKKRKYIKQKQRKYYEAKKSLIRSGKRVKSVLSLSDQSSSYSSHPIEKITSTLSLTSIRNNSVSRYNDSRRSSLQDKRNSLILNQLNSTAASPSSPRGRKSLSKKVEEDEIIAAPSMSPTLAEMSNSTQPPPPRVVFDPADVLSIRRNSISRQASILSDLNKRKSKDNKLLSKLQFWKKSKKSFESPDLDNSSTLQDQDLNFSLRQSFENSMDSNLKRSTELPDSVSPFQQVNNKRSATNVFPEDDKIQDFNTNTKLQQSIQLIENRPKDSFSTKLERPRPVSMISQFSQFSQLSNMSHISTMGSEFLEESDVMDEDYDFEGEGTEAYESSIDNSHESKKHPAPIGYTASPSGSKTPTKKRPKYTRNQSSDFSIASSSTANTSRYKKISLSNLSSNSSDESNSSTPLILENITRENLDKYHRPASPDLPKSKEWKNSIFSNNLNNPIPQYPNAFAPLPSSQILRSNSPPIKPFNRLNFKLNRHGGTNDKKSKQPSNVSLSDDKYSSQSKSNTYQPVITEEEELTS